jgi:peptidyl-prolyl cis-trans isomerase C
VAFLTERELHNAYFKKHVVDAITPEEVKARYEKEIAAIEPQEEVRARHILVKTEQEAKDVIAALSSIIDVKLLAADASKEGLQDTADFKQRLAFLTDRELHNAYFKKHVVDSVTPEEVKARYDKEVAAIEPQDEIRARHILVKTEDEAKAIIAELDAGKDFVEIAKEKSTDPNKSEGGDLGYFAKGRMVPEFEAAAFALEKGAYTKTPVKTQFGYHVIKVEDKRKQQPPALDQVEGQVRQLVMRDKYLDLLEKAKAAAPVDITDAALKTAYDAVNKPEAEAKDGEGEAAPATEGQQ